MGIRSSDIMADSADAKQMLVTLDGKLGWGGSILASCCVRGDNAG